jgi:CBS domain containing-hemolysin-like protein
MSEGDSSSFWRRLRGWLGGDGHEPSLRESLEEAIDEAPAPGDDLSAGERTMLKNLLHFGERLAGDVAVPRRDMVMFDIDEGFAALVALFREAGHSRVPVWEGERDNIIGMAHIKDVFAHIADTFDDEVSSAPLRALPIKPLLREVLWAPASQRVTDLLAQMRAARIHMAIIFDEFAAPDGLVTIEDLVEEIVGDIEDEHDEAVVARLHRLADGGWDADAGATITEVEQALGTDLTDDAVGDDVDTLGGLVFMLAGRVLAPGESVDHPKGWRLEVLAGDPRRVERVRIAALPA